MKRLHYFLLIALVIASCSPQQERPILPDPGYFGLIGQQTIPFNLKLGNGIVGGLSGIDFIGDSSFLAITDDGSEFSPARYYQIRLAYDTKGFERILLDKVFYQRQLDGSMFPSLDSAVDIYVDPESIRYDKRTDQVLWTSEGYIDNRFRPMLFLSNRNGRMQKAMNISSRYAPSDEAGPRHNGAFEGLTLVPDTSICWISMEYPMLQDGEKASYEDNGAPVRMIKYNYETEEVLAEFGYEVEPVFSSGYLAGFGGNGVVEILWHADDQLLVLERSYVPHSGNYIRLFLADFTNATDIKEIGSLGDTSVQVANKTLLLDLNQLPIDHIDNIEGFSWGKTLSNDRQTMVFVSDNNFNESQVTQFLVVERIKPF